MLTPNGSYEYAFVSVCMCLSVCVCVSVCLWCVHIHMGVKDRSMWILHLDFWDRTGSLTEPRAHGFGQACWPMTYRALPPLYPLLQPYHSCFPPGDRNSGPHAFVAVTSPSEWITSPGPSIISSCILILNMDWKTSTEFENWECVCNFDRCVSTVVKTRPGSFKCKFQMQILTW